MQLSSARVEEIFTDCCIPAGDLGITTIDIQGVANSARLDLYQVDAHQEEIRDLLHELPGDFLKSGGGGMSFLNACYDRHGEQWTSFHLVMEKLFMLGLATGDAKLLLPRDTWKILPGGMPYYVVK